MVYLALDPPPEAQEEEGCRLYVTLQTVSGQNHTSRPAPHATCRLEKTGWRALEGGGGTIALCILSILLNVCSVTVLEEQWE